jgi:molybdenum cofactor cytidylyltransferase
MARAPSFCGVILAAGESSRMGTDKALLPWHGGTFLSGAIALLSPVTDLVIVVAGHNTARLAPIVFAQGAFLVENPDPQRGQFSSLCLGLQEVLNRGRDAAIVMLVDRPPARGETVHLLRQKFLEAVPRGAWAVVPRYGERNGHPLLAGREMLDAFLRAPQTSNAREVEHLHRERIEYVPVEDPLVIANVDTPEDYQRLTAEHTPA